MMGFAGGYIVGATPVPIPNTAVKPDKPMILLQRESRYCRLYTVDPGPRFSEDRGSFLSRGRGG